VKGYLLQYRLPIWFLVGQIKVVLVPIDLAVHGHREYFRDRPDPPVGGGLVAIQTKRRPTS